METQVDANEKILNIDFNVNSSKELYYQICSFLMKNGIINGCICSDSKEVLEGLGEYMSSIKIPWCFAKDRIKEEGYVFIDGAITSDKIEKYGALISLKGNNRIQIIVKNKTFNIAVENKNEIYKELDRINIGNPIHLKNEQIRNMFLKAFKIAEYEIDIISPWMNFGVVNEYFIELMSQAFKRGVIIKIIYGLKSDSSEFNLSRSHKSDEVATFLKKKFREYEKQLYIKRDNIHYKLVLCDEKFKLEGGYNYLSFMGDYENKDARKEGSPFGTEVEEIRFLRKEYFKKW